jgi:thioredoxin-like negative regulator of GroEL
VKQHRLVVIHVWAEWNGYDPPLDRDIQSIQGDYRGSVCFASCSFDQEEYWEYFRIWNVLNIPALVCYVHGQFHRCVLGCLSVERLRSLLSELVDTNNNQEAP